MKWDAEYLHIMLLKIPWYKGVLVIIKLMPYIFNYMLWLWVGLGHVSSCDPVVGSHVSSCDS